MAQQLPLIDTEAPTATATATASRRSRTVGPGGRRRSRATGPRALAVVADRPDVVVEVDGPDWRIDEHTKRLGMAGVAAAREALAAAVAHSAA